ncbi:MAG: mevalonate kinase family protein [Promethearchaeota archaeon]
MKKFSVEVPGRICLMGDKVDLLGKPVIGAAINLMMKIIYEEKSKNEVEFYSYNTGERIFFDLDKEPPYDIDLAYWSVLYKRLREHIKRGFRMEVKSEIPIGAGLSTSAAISIGFIKAINKAYKLGLHAQDIAELAYLGEHHDLGIQCGRLDQYTEAFGGVVFIHTDENPRVEPLDVQELPIVVGDSIEERKASSLLNRIKQEIKENNKETLNAFKVIENCVYQARDALLQKDYKKLGKLMDKQQEQEIILGAHTDKILEMCKASKKAGALGAKQMGAGGGGCMLAICPGKQEEVVKAIENVGGKAWIFDIFNY